MNKVRMFLAGACLVISAAATAQNEEPIDGIVAVVEEDVILRSQLDRALGRVVQQFRAANRQLPPRDVLEKQILDQLIMIELQIQRARDTGIRASEEDVDRALERVAGQAGLTVEQLRRTVAADGLSWAEFREEMRDEILTSRLRNRIATTRVNVTETEVDIALASQNLDTSEYRLAHILISTPEGASPEDIRAAEEKAQDVYAQLQGGMDFATAAITYSDGQQALEGGDLGWRSADQVPSMFASMIAELEIGQTATPVRSASGFHILRLTDKREQTQRMVEEFRVQHLMIQETELVSPTDALNMINDLHSRLMDGEDFGELAKSFSDDTSSANLGGDMGWFQAEAFAGTFGQRGLQVVAQLDEGEISQPFQTGYGWHIFKKTGEREQDRTEEIIRAQVRESLREQKAQEELELFMRQMRDEAYVEYRI
ncbi:MAG: peptidylprolyl isomerase [Xanthomonadales bacterium]|nr:peptidylprolyl isomerase [Xanthomonadales bacterium]